MFFRTSAAALFIAFSSIAQEKPAVVWWSDPVGPGELVQLHGGAWGTNPVVEVVALADRSPRAPVAPAPADFSGARRAFPLKVTETGVCFEYPRELKPGLAACRVVAAPGVASEPFVLNAPAAWWLHGDLGAAASPGGWLRLFGRCLDVGGRARLVLRPAAADARDVELPLTTRDTWSLAAALPNSLPPGRYAAFVHNGCGGRDGWREAGTVEIRPYAEVWKNERFDVTRFGAIPNDGLDDTLALQAALAMAATNGGGTVYLPRGRFQCNGTLRIPERTLLRGESRETTELYWPDCEEPPENLIEGTSAFGIEDLFIHSGKYRNGIVCVNETSGKHELSGGAHIGASSPHDITLRRVRLKLIIDQYLIKNTDEYERRAYLRGNGVVVRDARFVRVEDCDIYCSKEGSTTLYFVLEAEHLRIADCRINGSGWAVVGGDRVIFENNDAYNCTYSVAPVCRNLYWGNNRQHDLFTNNRESITHDGARTAFRGLVTARCDGVRAALDFGAAKPGYQNGPGYWVGRQLQLVEGRGAGQTRTILALTNDVATLDRPWSIAPDATSLFTVAAERTHLLYVDNVTEDSSVAIQLYGGLTDGVLSRNRCARSGGFRGFGMDYHGIIPLWFVQMLDNEIREGNSYRGPSNEMPPRDSTLEIADHGNGLTLTRSCVMRHNVLRSNARIDMNSENGLVEGNAVSNADLGIAVGAKHAPSVVLRGNRLENVREPLDAVTRQSACMHPAERLLAQLAGAESALAVAPPAEWASLRKRLARAAAETAAADPRAQAEAQADLLLALRTLSAATPAGTLQDLRVAESLLGGALRVQSWDNGMTRLLASTNAAEANVRLLAAVGPNAPATSCAIAFGPIPGWTFSEDKAAVLAAGATTSIDAHFAAPAGPKGFFRMPATATFSGDGWSLACRTALRTLTQNRICQWAAATPGGTWRPLTDANVHGAMTLAPWLANSPTGSTATAVTVLRVARPTPLRFEFEGPILLTVDGVRIGTNIQNGRWGNTALAPGDHLLMARFTLKKRAEVLFKVSCETADSCLPGDLLVLPAEEILRHGALPAP